MTRRHREPPLTSPATDPRRYVSMVVAAAYLNITRKTLGEWLDEGRLPHFNFGSRRRLLVSDIAAFERKAQRST